MKLTLSAISGGYLPVATINTNSDAIETALENTLSRDGTSPNQMVSNLDMNSYRILNVGTPVADTEVANKAYVDSSSGGSGSALTTQLIALSTVVASADRLPYFTAANTADVVTFTAAGRALLDDSTASDQLTTLGVSTFAKTILDDTTAAGVRTTIGAGVGDLLAANNLSDVTASTARTNLGLVIGTNVQAFNTNLTAINQALTSTSSPSFTLITSNLTGTASLATSLAGGSGGTVPYQSAAGVTAMLANGTVGQVLTSGGTTVAPTWTTVAGTGDLLSTNNLSDVVSAATARTNLGLAIGTNVQAYNSNLTAINQALTTTSTPSFTTVTADLTGTASVATKATNIAGGLGGQIPYQSAADTTALLANGTVGQVLQSNGTTAAPSWVTVTGTGDMMAANNLSDVVSAATSRTNLGLAIGTNVQAYNVNLTAIDQALTTTSSPSFTLVTANLTGTASIATNLAGGSGGTIPYQSAARTTAMLANGTAGQILKSNGTTVAPSWVTASGTGDMLSTNNLSDVASAPTARTNLGLGTIATQAASAVAITGGTASGLTNLVTSEFGSSLSTSTAGTTIPNNSFGGSWLTHSVVNYTDTATHASDSRIALGVSNYANPGSGTNGPGSSDYAGFFSTKKADHTNAANTNAGEIDGLYATVAQSVLGDCAAILADARKRSGSALYGCLAIEWASSLVGASDTASISTAIHGHIGWCYGDASQVYGYVAEAWTGTGTSAFLVDTYSTGAWTNAFAVRSGRSDGNLTFNISASGIARGAAGSAGAPTWGFVGDTNTGMYSSTADEMAFTAGGTARYVMNTTAMRPATDNVYTLGHPSFRWSNIYCTTFTASSLGGTLTTGAQPNITSLGTLSALTVSATISGSVSGNANKLDNSGHFYTFSGGSSAGSSTATFANTIKPGSSSSNIWVNMLIDGVSYWIPVWPN